MVWAPNKQLEIAKQINRLKENAAFQEQQRRQELIDNPPPMPGPSPAPGGAPQPGGQPPAPQPGGQPGMPGMGLDMQPGVNPFAQAAHNAGFSDFADVPAPPPQPAPQTAPAFTPGASGANMLNMPYSYGNPMNSRALQTMATQAQALRGGANQGATGGGQSNG